MRETIKLNLHWKNNTIEGITDGALEEDIKKIHETFCQTVVKSAIPKIKSFALTEMEGYYAEYTPRFYDRTNKMRYESYQEYEDNKGKVYKGGIIIDSSFTEHEGLRYKGYDSESYGSPNITEDEIYTNVWDRGSHGFYATYKTRISGIYMSDVSEFIGKPHRFESLKKKVSSDKFLNRLKNSGISAVQKQKYSVLRFA